MDTYIDADVFLQYLKDAEEKTIKLATRKALLLSSGKFKAKRLAKLGHPYAVRNAGKMSVLRPGRLDVPYGDPAKINIQTGEFYLSWKWSAAKVNGDSLVSFVTNDAPYADKLEKGIPGLTIPRPLIEKLIPIVTFHRERNLMIALRDAIRSQKT